MLTIKVIDNAIKAHEEWKDNLRVSVDRGHTELNANDVINENLCELGRWINTLNQNDLNNHDLINIKNLHTHFHQVAAAIVNMIKFGESIKAKQSIEVGGEYNLVSSKLILALIASKKAILSSSNMESINSINKKDGAKIKALIVNDDLVTRRLLQQVLESLGCHVDQAENGIQAIEHMQDKNEPHDICFFDIQMPMMGGLDAVKVIRELVDKNIPIIAVSSSELIADKLACLKAGMDDYIRSPFTPEILKEKLEIWI